MTARDLARVLARDVAHLHAVLLGEARHGHGCISDDPCPFVLTDCCPGGWECETTYALADGPIPDLRVHRIGYGCATNPGMDV